MSNHPVFNKNRKSGHTWLPPETLRDTQEQLRHALALLKAMCLESVHSLNFPSEDASNLNSYIAKCL